MKANLLIGIILISYRVYSQNDLRIDVGDTIVLCDTYLEAKKAAVTIQGGTPPYSIKWFIRDSIVMSQMKELYGPDGHETFFISQDSAVTELRRSSLLMTPESGVEIFAIVTDSNGKKSIDSTMYYEGWTMLNLAILETTIKKGDSTQLGTNVGRSWPIISYRWYPSESLSDPKVCCPLAYPEESTTYKLELIDKYRCTMTDQFVVIVEE